MRGSHDHSTVLCSPHHILNADGISECMGEVYRLGAHLGDIKLYLLVNHILSLPVGTSSNTKLSIFYFICSFLKGVVMLNVYSP